MQFDCVRHATPASVNLDRIDFNWAPTMMHPHKKLRYLYIAAMPGLVLVCLIGMAATGMMGHDKTMYSFGIATLMVLYRVDLAMIWLSTPTEREILAAKMDNRPLSLVAQILSRCLGHTLARKAGAPPPPSEATQ